jgi:pre-mRNA-splicing factor CWC22
MSGLYVPPHRLPQLSAESGDQSSLAYQKLTWELLRKSLNGLVNKINVSNLKHIVYELFNENLLRGKGLFARSLLKAQMAAPNFSHIHASLVAVINTKLPEIGALVLHRVILQFQRAYKRSDKLLCIASCKLLAHLVNQQVAHELVALQLAALLLETPTDDSVEIACDFLAESGQVLNDLCPQGVNAVFERLRGLLHEGEISRRVQYAVESLMAVRKNKFRDHPGVLKELDLVEDVDKITHEVGLDDDLSPQDELNVFRLDTEFTEHEAEWTEIRKEILGGDEYLGEEEEDSEGEDPNAELIRDFSERDRLNLRKTVYLVIMSSVDFEECANKILKLKVSPAQTDVVATMFIEGCIHESKYSRFFGLLAQRFCQLDELYKGHFERAFIEHYRTIHRFSTNELRNLARFFSHLFYTEAIDWELLRHVQLTKDTTNASSRIFLKIFFQELSESMGVATLKERLGEDDLQPSLEGIFPRNSAKDLRFAVNFFISIGLGAITDKLRELYEQMSSDESQEEEPSSDEESSEEEEELRNNKAAAARFLQTELKRRSRSRSR